MRSRPRARRRRHEGRDAARSTTERGRTCPPKRLSSSPFARPRTSSAATPRPSACHASARPAKAGRFRSLIVRTHANGYFGYVNACPHEGIWLNFGDGNFFTPDRAFLKCGRHGSIFEIETGLCIDGPCKEKSLEPLALAVVDGDVCVYGIALVEDDAMPNPFDDLDDTMEIMIHPD